MTYKDRSAMRRRELKTLVERVKAALSIKGYTYAIINYPSKYRERSIDVVAASREGRLLIRIKVSSARINKDEARDLMMASRALDAVPIVVSSDRDMIDNVVYEKDGIFIVNERTFENILLKPEEVFTICKKGEFYVPIDPKAISRKRYEKGLSLGDVSYLTGISRRTIYGYEKEGGMVTLETAERLLDVLGEEVIRSVTISLFKEEVRQRPVKREERTYVRIARVFGGTIYELRKSAPDFLVTKEEELDIVVDASIPARFSVKDVIRKVEESLKMSLVLDGEVEVLVNKEYESVIKDELSTRVSLNKLDMIRLT
jgi:putative transcriptional regulator